MAQSSPDAPHGMRTFLIIWTGQLISIIGSGLTSFALGVWIFEQTDQATPFALVVLCGALPRILLAPIAGSLADRWNRRWLMILADVGSALVTLGVVKPQYLDLDPIDGRIYWTDEGTGGVLTASALFSVTMTAILQALPMVQAVLLLGIYALLPMVVVLSLATGALIGVLVSMGMILRLKQQAGRLRRKLQRAEQAADHLSVLPAKH